MHSNLRKIIQMDNIKIDEVRFFKTKSIWKELYSTNELLSPYSSFEFAYWYHRFLHLAPSNILIRERFFIVKDMNNKPLAILPFIHRKNRYYLYGDMCSSGYLDIITRNHLSNEAYDEIFSLLSARIENITLYFNKINERSNLLPYLLCKTKEKSFSACVNISFGENYDEYFKSLSKNVRQNIRTAHNRLNREGLKYDVKVLLNKKITKAILKEELNIYVKRAETRVAKGFNVFGKFYIKKLDPITISLANMSNNFHSILYIENEIAAFIAGYIRNDGKTIVVPRHAINQKYSLYSPGALLISETIKYCIKNSRIRNLDLSRGDEKYKYAMGGKTHYNYSFVISF